MMTATRKSIPLLLALALLGSVSRAGAENARAGVGGRVLSETSPLPAAGVYAYQLADLSLHKVLTDSKGSFLFKDLPAGLYKIIAHKPGFEPAVVMLIRTTAQTYQVVELQLAEQPRGAAGGHVHSDDFWLLRSRIPSDVLRDIDREERDEVSVAQLATIAMPQRLDLTSVAKAGFTTRMQAMTGVDQISSSSGSLVSGAGVGIEGMVGKTQVGLHGSFWQLNGDSMAHPGTASAVSGQASTMSLDITHGAGSSLNITSYSNKMTRRIDGDGPVDFEHYQVKYTQGVGENGRSDFSATYTAESNFNHQAAIEPVEIPEASQTWRVEEAYTTSLGDTGTLQTGLRYRELRFGNGITTAVNGRPVDQPASGSIDLFSRGGVRVQPAMLLEYGMYSTLSDGTLSLMPQGGVVFQLGSSWQLEGSGSRRVYRDVAPTTFLPTLFDEADLCEQASDSCYQVSLARKPAKTDTDSSISLTGTQRRVGDTLRLYFSKDAFDRLESLYLVRGDVLPELRLQVTKHLTPKVVTTFESSLAQGGGGTFLAADQRPYENRVRYMVASLDTQFLRSSTGVFLAFHHLSQELDPLGTPAGLAPQMEVERVRLMLTQDLNFMLDLASDWAVQLNMELSRGPVSAANQDNGLRHRLMGGIAVKF